MRWDIALQFVFWIILEIQRDGVVNAKIRKPPGIRTIQNSRTRFQQRINRLGPKKMDLIKMGVFGKSRGLPSGFVLLNGQVIDSTNKIIQRMTLTGTAYYGYNDRNFIQPLYVRPGNELGWHFVVFQDPFYWRGSGHLILLKKVLGVNINKSVLQQNNLYEAYTLSLRVSLHPRVHIRDPVYRQRLRKRQRKVKKVIEQRKQFRGGGAKNHLRDMKGKVGRKKRETFSFNEITFDRGDCIITRMNVTNVALRMERMVKNQTSSSARTPSSEPHRFLRAMPIHIMPE